MQEKLPLKSNAATAVDGRKRLGGLQHAGSEDKHAETMALSGRKVVF